MRHLYGALTFYSALVCSVTLTQSLNSTLFMFCLQILELSVLFSRLFESLCSNEFPCGLHPSGDDDDDEGRSGLSSAASLAGSRTSSQWSLVKGVAADGEDDETVRGISCYYLKVKLNTSQEFHYSLRGSFKASSRERSFW